MGAFIRYFFFSSKVCFILNLHAPSLILNLMLFLVFVVLRFGFRYFFFFSFEGFCFVWTEPVYSLRHSWLIFFSIFFNNVSFISLACLLCVCIWTFVFEVYVTEIILITF